MLKKKSREQKRNHSKKKQPVAKKSCPICQMKLGLTVHIQEALQRKYSTRISYFLRIEDAIQSQKRQKPERMYPNQEFMEKYYKPVQRKHQFYKIKQIYQLHKQAPKIYMAGVVDILNKRHYRKRLLQYFKIAKILGLKVTGAKTSTFLYSLSKTVRPQDAKGSYQKILGQISTYQLSQQIERELLQNLERGAQGRKGLNPELSILEEKTKNIAVERYQL